MFLAVFLYMEYENVTINSERWFDNKNSDECIDKYNPLNKSKKVVQLDLNNNIVCVYDTLHEAERITGVWMTQIRKCCNREPMYKTAKGYKWCWESDYCAR